MAPIYILTGAFDDHYRNAGIGFEGICTSAGKRLKLYEALAAASGCDPVLLSPQPRRPEAKAVAAVTTCFGRFEQRFAPASGIAKLRVALDIVRFANFVAKSAPEGSVFVLDNYELIYVVALLWRRLLGGGDTVILEYEDGKHAIDRGIFRWMSGLAEWLGKPLVSAAVLATPTLGKRLPPGLPTVCVPGILDADPAAATPAPSQDPVRQFLYSGSLDHERGLPLLLDFIGSKAVPAEARFHITGAGLLAEECKRCAEASGGKLEFHGKIGIDELQALRARCHFGLNLQRSGDPISDVTYPSKTFDYLNAGLRIISTSAAGVPEVLGDAAIYLESETVEGLAKAIGAACHPDPGTTGVSREVLQKYSLANTVRSLREMLGEIGVDHRSCLGALDS